MIFFFKVILGILRGGNYGDIRVTEVSVQNREATEVYLGTNFFPYKLQFPQCGLGGLAEPLLRCVGLDFSS